MATKDSPEDQALAQARSRSDRPTPGNLSHDLELATLGRAQRERGSTSRARLAGVVLSIGTARACPGSGLGIGWAEGLCHLQSKQPCQAVQPDRANTDLRERPPASKDDEVAESRRGPHADTRPQAGSEARLALRCRLLGSAQTGSRHLPRLAVRRWSGTSSGRSYATPTSPARRASTATAR